LSNSGKPVVDNENDSLLFERLERNAIEHFPNPSRLGCPPKEVLKKFVESPGRVSVRDLNDLHVFHCAECTLDLKRFREEREERLAREKSSCKTRGCWIAIGPLLFLGVSLSIAKLVLDKQAAVPGEYVTNLVLRDGSVKRGPEAGPVVPHAKVTLNIELGPAASAGTYKVVISKQRSMDNPTLESVGDRRATASGPHLLARFDLRDVPPGVYWVGIRNNASGRAWFTFVSLE
jgi:hypothetical protein